MRLELPGMFDLQVNGFGGVDFNDPAATRDELSGALARVRETGVTRCLPTLITSSFERFRACARALMALEHPLIAGLHMEGPYIAPEDGPRGAHPAAAVIPADIDDFKRRQEAAGGGIRLVTLAPEVPGALRLTKWLIERGVRVAIGHTAATPGQIRDAVAAGATLSTHLGNGCAQQLPRHPNLLWEQLANDGLHASFIVDGHHLPPATVKAMVRAKSAERTLLISDATAAAGCAPGRYVLNGGMIDLTEDGRVSPPGEPWLAGSALTLDRAVSNVVAFTGIPLAAAWAMASSQPARFLGMEPVGTVRVDWDPAACRLNVHEVLDPVPS